MKVDLEALDQTMAALAAEAASYGWPYRYHREIQDFRRNFLPRLLVERERHSRGA